MRCRIMLLLVLAIPVHAEQDGQPSEADEALPVVKLTPTMRAIDEPPYARLPCEELSRVQPQTNQQRAALADRKRQCLGKYDAFLSQPGIQ